MITKIPPSSITNHNLKSQKIQCGDSVSTAFTGNPVKGASFYRNKKLHSLLNFANDKQLLFGATYALLLTCVLRPGSIVLMPSKKNKDDQKYAAAHSIASGLIGLGISTLLFYPLEIAVKNLGDRLDKLTDPKKLATAIQNGDEFAKKFENSYLNKNGKAYLETAKTYLGRLGDLVGSVPKGILTIALIPPILKYVFGMEKKKSSEVKTPNANNVIITNTNNNPSPNFKSLTNEENSIFSKKFSGGLN